MRRLRVMLNARLFVPFCFVCPCIRTGAVSRRGGNPVLPRRIRDVRAPPADGRVTERGIPPEISPSDGNLTAQ